jgi:hypothetical protein
MRAYWMFAQAASLAERGLDRRHTRHIPPSQRDAQAQNKKLRNRRRNRVAAASRKQNRG